MAKIDEIINEQLSDIHNVISMLHKHWIKSGAIRDEKEDYYIKMDEKTLVAYLPTVNKIGMAFPGRVKGFEHGMVYCKDGSLNFTDHMDEKAMNHFSEILRHIRGEIFSIRDKAMAYSPLFMLEVKQEEMLRCSNEIFNNFLKKDKLLNPGKTISSEFLEPVEVEIINNLSGQRYFVSLDFDNMSLQFLKKTPSGENELLTYASKSKITGLPDHVGFNNTDNLIDKNIILKACLFEAQVFNSSLKHEIKGLEQVAEIRKKEQENGELVIEFK